MGARVGRGVTWKNLKCILPSQRSQSENATYCVITTIWKGEIMETVSRPVVARGSKRQKE